MDKQSEICLSIVVSVRFYAVRPWNLFVQKKKIMCWSILFYRWLRGKVNVAINLSRLMDKIICLSKFYYIKSSSGIFAYCVSGECFGGSFRGWWNDQTGSMSSISGASSRSVLPSILKFSTRAIGLSKTSYALWSGCQRLYPLQRWGDSMTHRCSLALHRIPSHSSRRVVLQVPCMDNPQRIAYISFCLAGISCWKDTHGCRIPHNLGDHFLLSYIGAIVNCYAVENKMINMQFIANCDMR